MIVDTSDLLTDWTVFDAHLTIQEGEAQIMLVFTVAGPSTVWIDDIRSEEV